MLHWNKFTSYNDEHAENVPKQKIKVNNPKDRHFNIFTEDIIWE